MSSPDPLLDALHESRATLDAYLDSPAVLSAHRRFIEAAALTFRSGGRLLSCGNGGSMCDAMHFAEEWVGQFRKPRPGLPALALSDPGALSCIANDYGYDEVFARSLAAHGKRGDMLVAISTSGNSPNVLRAIEVARELGVQTVGLLGKGGGKANDLVDIALVVPHATDADRIQEMHIKILHTTIELVERELFPENYA